MKTDQPPPYSSANVACVKCLNVGASAQYMSGGGREWLRRTCRQCGFHWQEATVDFTEAAWDARTMGA